LKYNLSMGNFIKSWQTNTNGITDTYHIIFSIDNKCQVIPQKLQLTHPPPPPRLRR
jgi:hypothetical protein